MPYCPRCDMEFVKGITHCSDCKGELAESKEAYEEALAREREQARQRMGQAGWDGSISSADALEPTANLGPTSSLESTANLGPTGALEPTAPSDSPDGHIERAAHDAYGLPDASPGPEPSQPQARVYIRKSQKYEDLKSSAWAFTVIGAVLTAASLLAWTGIIRIPVIGPSRLIMQGMLTFLGIGCLAVALLTARSTCGMAGQVREEERRTRDLIQWFTDRYRPAQVDSQIAGDTEDMSAEELALKRFEVIQDILITQNDLPDQSYADMLCEEIYSRLFDSPAS